MNENEIMDLVKEVRSNLEEMKKAEAMKSAPVNRGNDAGTNWEDVKSALMEKRAITSNGAGAVSVSDDIYSVFVDKGKFANLVSRFDGVSASSVIPVFSPHLALPVGSAEGATSIGADGTAVLGAKSITPKPYYSPLAVSRLALLATNFGAKMKEIFGAAFAASIDKQILVGDGTGNNGLGIFTASASGVPTSQDIACAATGYPKIADLVKLAINIIGSTNDMGSTRIVMHPTVFSNILADSTAGNDPYKYELKNLSIMGIPVILSTYCPSVSTASTYVVAGGNFKDYAFAYANELTVDEIKTAGSDNITFQAFQYMNFTPIVGASFFRLKTI